MEVCIYCGEPRGEKMGCCGENHWDDVPEDPADPCEKCSAPCYQKAEDMFNSKQAEIGGMPYGTYGGISD